MTRMTAASADATTITTPWPAGFSEEAPGIRGFAVREVAAPADAVYAWILRPDLQEPYYGALRRVRTSVGAADLTVGATASFLLGPCWCPR